MKTKMFDLISTKEITHLWELDSKININKYGKYNYYKIYEFNYSHIWKFLYELENNKVYLMIPFITKNCKSNEPIIILSPQILVTHNSNSLLISKYIQSKVIETADLYGINENKLDNMPIIFKFKQIKINFNEQKLFSYLF